MCRVGEGQRQVGLVAALRCCTAHLDRLRNLTTQQCDLRMVMRTSAAGWHGFGSGAAVRDGTGRQVTNCAHRAGLQAG